MGNREIENLFSSKLPLEELPAVAKLSVRAQDRRWLVADVHHAVFAARIASAAVLFPWRFFEEVLEGGVVRIGHEITRPLPAARIVGGIAPGRAHHLPVTAQILE